MVTRETSYIGQLYFGLSTDDPADIAEWHNGDRILLMDIDEMYVFDEATPGFKQISMGGGGGGGSSGGYELIGSGDFTQASDASSTVTIPISSDVVGGNLLFVVRDDTLSNVQYTYSWLRQYSAAFPSEISAVFGTMFCYHYYEIDGTLRVGNQSGHIWWTSGTSVSIQPATTGGPYKIKAGLYHWYVYKVTP